MNTLYIVLLIFLVGFCFVGGFVYSSLRSKMFDKKVAKYVEDEINLFSKAYEFKNHDNWEACFGEIKNEIIDHRSKFKIVRSYLERSERKIKKIQSIVDKYVTKDKNETKKSFSKSAETYSKSNETIQEPIILSHPSEPEPLITSTHSSNKLQNQTCEFTSLKIANWNNRFVLIDFETANSSRTSACQIGMVVVENNQITFQYSQLVKPEPFYFDPFNIDIHGITEAMVQDAKNFSEIWEEIKLYFNGDYIILAHNAAFDIAGVLKQSLSLYQLTCERFNYGCTVQMFRKNPHFHFPNYRLATLAKTKNIKFQHHDALEDSLVLLKIINEYYGDVESFYESSINQYRYRLKEITKNEG